MYLDYAIQFVHVLAWVFWLGTDLGVFIGSRYTENPKYSVDTRMVILDLVLKIDKAPRLMVPVVFATGVYLSNRFGIDYIPNLAGWIIGAIWFGVIWVAVNSPPGSKNGAIASKINLGFYAAVIAAMGIPALMSLTGEEFLPGWLAVKWLAFAWIALFAIGIDLAVKPAIRDYLRLRAEGSTDEINASLSRSLLRVYFTVWSVYAGTIVAAFFGLMKPF